MDNNVLASKEFPQIIQDIIDCGFGKGAMFTPPNQLEIAIRNLKVGINDRAYIRKSQSPSVLACTSLTCSQDSNTSLINS